ncbi:MAG: hypothetical protein ABIJ21_05080 [Nanoarchaeota archaeon]
MELLSIKDWNLKEKTMLLRELGFSLQDIFIIDKNGKKVVDKYIEQPVTVDNMLILPGSTLIIDNNPLSIASFLEEHPNAL